MRSIAVIAAVVVLATASVGFSDERGKKAAKSIPTPVKYKPLELKRGLTFQKDQPIRDFGLNDFAAGEISKFDAVHRDIHITMKRGKVNVRVPKEFRIQIENGPESTTRNFADLEKVKDYFVIVRSSSDAPLIFQAICRNESLK